MFGPIFNRELAITPRRPRIYLYRAVYAAGLIVLISTAWLVLAGAQVIRCVGDMSRFGTMMFQIVAPLQLALITFFSMMTAASSVALEKDRRTLILLLMTRMTNSELVVGKLLASLLNVLVIVATAIPIFMLSVLFGGISFAQVGRVFAVTLATALLAGSLGAIIAFWRDKTFQTLALTALIACFWVGFWEAVGAGLLGSSVLGIPCRVVAQGFSPLQAVMAAARPFIVVEPGLGAIRHGVNLYLLISALLSVAMCVIAVLRVRKWNPSRQVRALSAADDGVASIWGAEHDLEQAQQSEQAEAARAGHVDSQLRAQSAGESRPVWDNPVLWRELRTWAYGRKVIVIRVSYLLLAISAAIALHSILGQPSLASQSSVIPATAKPLAPLFLVSLVIINALAVTSVTTERDGLSLDLLLTTDLSPHEFVFGKLGGVFSVAGLMVICPLLLTLYLWFRGGINTENLVLISAGLIIMDIFVATLGIHCGMRYGNSRSAIGVSMGTVFFLFMGVLACMLMMISFSGSFQIQLAPFLAFILGGGVGLYVAIGAGNPSKAIALASIVAPFATFYGITSFLLGHNLSVFLVTATTYGFATAAMLIPALFEFDFAMGRTSSAEE